MLRLPGSGPVYFACAFSPDGETFAAGGLGRCVDVWDLTHPESVAWQIDTGSVPVPFLAYTPEGGLVVVRSLGAIQLAPPHGQEIVSCWHIPNTVKGAALSLRGDRLITTGSRITIWELGTDIRDLIELDCAPGERFTSVALSPDDRHIAAARIAIDGQAVIELLDADSGGFLHVIPAPGEQVDRLAWSPDGRYLAGLVDRHLTVWDATTDSEILAPLENSGRGTAISLAFHPTRAILMIGTTRGEVILWDTSCWRPQLTYRWGTGLLYTLAIAPDGQRAAAAGIDGPVLWDLDA